MSLRLLITRASPGTEETAARVRSMGGEAVLAPMLRIETRKANVDLAGAQALVFTSANGVRAFAAESDARSLPALCVGEATAAAARAAGFTATHAPGAGDVAALARWIADTRDPAAGALIHFSGEDVVGDLRGALAGFSTERRIVYAAVAATGFPDHVLSRLRATPPALDVVVFHSPRGAAVFCALAAGLAPAAAPALTAACLSPNVAQAAAALAWRAVVTAQAPEENALLAAAFGGGPRP